MFENVCKFKVIVLNLCTKSKVMKSKIEAVATFLMMDVSELKEYRYHYGRTTQAVWALSDAYYCCTKEKENPAKHRDGMTWNWIEVKDDLVNSKGFKIWESK